MTTKLEVSSFDELNLDIYVVGYPEQGESILCILRENESSLFVMLIDTYTPTTRTNYVADILDGIGKPSIDMLVWTHPDKDHSLGLSQIMDTYDGNHEASVYVPSHLSDIAGKEAMIEFSKLLSFYNPKGKGTILHTQLNEISTCFQEVRTPISIEIFERNTLSKIHFEISFFLPNSSRAIRYADNWDTSKTNEHSIVHSIVFNGLQYVFCGDITKNNINLLPEKIYSNVKFIKIPHHGSYDPSILAGRMMEHSISDIISASTTFTLGKIDNPDDRTIEVYKKISPQIFSTGKDNKSDYGCIKLTMDKTGNLLSYELRGNAIQY